MKAFLYIDSLHKPKEIYFLVFHKTLFFSSKKEIDDVEGYFGRENASERLIVFQFIFTFTFYQLKFLLAKFHSFLKFVYYYLFINHLAEINVIKTNGVRTLQRDPSEN